MKDRITYTLKEGVADIRLVRADKSNALDRAMFDALIACGQELKGMKDLRVAVLSGEGKGFCAGIDMSVLAKMQSGMIADEKDFISRKFGICNRFQYAALIWRELSVPVIAAVHGFALGGGFQLALGADMRYVKPDAKLAVMEVKWGLVPDMCATHLMPSLAREDIIRELGFTGRVFDGTQAQEYGFATHLSDDPYQLAMNTAQDIAAKSPDAIRAYKRLINGVYVAPARQRLMEETVEQQALIGSPNQLETILADKEDRTPRFED